MASSTFASPKIIQPLNFRSNEKPLFDSVKSSSTSCFLGSVKKLRISSKTPFSSSLNFRSLSTNVAAVSEVVKERKAKTSPSNLLITKEEGLVLYEDMTLGRVFEDMCAQMYYRGKMFGFVHLYNGQEAVSTGFIKLLKQADSVVSTYRDHVHALSKGVPARAVMSELFGKATGCCRGQGGSMHMFSKKKMNKGKHFHFFFLTLFFCLLSNILTLSNATDQVTNLNKMLKYKRSKNPSLAASWAALPAQIKGARVHVGPQNGLMESDKITTLPGQPNGVDFDQYSGYVTVDPAEEKELFYYFAESPKNSSSKPLVLWLNGGPGCSSFGNGGLQELGPFRVKSDGKTLIRNPYAWNNVANVLFLESPAGVGFSYGKESIIYNQTGDMSTAKDAYTFLVNWFERFPQYKNRDFYLTGESYAGHYVPQLAYTILHNNKNSKHGFINLRGIAIGNAWIDDATNTAGLYNYLWTHALYSDETYTKIQQFCNFSAAETSDECDEASSIAGGEIGNIDIYNIYAPVCLESGNDKAHILDSVEVYDPCSSTYVATYLNTKEVQKALHAKPKKWQSCSQFDWQDSPSTVLPVIQKLMASNITVWIYSGDVDGRVPVTASRYSINTFKLPIKTAWRPWYTHDQVGGYVVGYEGLVFLTVRGAGHLVPSYQPQRALTMVSSFLQGTLPPKS